MGRPSLALAPPAANVTLREHPRYGSQVVLAFAYEPNIVAAVRGFPSRRFDWDAREWSAPADDWVAVHVADLLARFPELTVDVEVERWLSGVQRRWVGHVSTTTHAGRGYLALKARAGVLPDAVATGATDRGDGTLLVVPTPEAVTALRTLPSARLDAPAERCLAAVEAGEQPPGAQLVLADGVEGQRLRLEVVLDHSIGQAFEALPSAAGVRSVPIDPWIVEQLDGFIAAHDVTVRPRAQLVLERLRAQAAEAAVAIEDSRALSGPPLAHVASVLGGELEPFQWGAVHYALRARRTFLADEQGLGKTVEALATLEADGAYPAVVVCPAALKLNWLRETRRWLPHRSAVTIDGRVAVPPPADITIVNYEIVAAQRGQLARRSLRALFIELTHYGMNPAAKRTPAVGGLAAAGARDGLRHALTGTPVLNHADELIAQLRVIGRLDDFGSGARFSRQFRGELSHERLHWHLRARCMVRRRKSQVLPQLPPKRQVVVPVALTNPGEYRLAERDVIEWLRTQPLDLAELNARIATTLRAERLAQLGALAQLAARGKLHPAMRWIEDFLASGEPLVVFARHIEVQHALVERFPDAVHLLGSDSQARREEAVRGFQSPDGPQLIVCATRVAAHGITLTRASNVAFLELEWTPALHDQAEDRCHRIGQRDAVCAWYLLAAETIDETMARVIALKRAVVGAVTDGERMQVDGMVDEVVRELRDGRPFRHLGSVGTA